ncbi:MAG: hypothetical protein QXT14_08835 [Candidatus Bathyarchaeia archaeon]
MTEKVSGWKETAVEKVYYDDSTRAIARVEVSIGDDKIRRIKLLVGGEELIISERIRRLIDGLEKKLEEQGYRW